MYAKRAWIPESHSGREVSDRLQNGPATVRPAAVTGL